MFCRLVLQAPAAWHDLADSHGHQGFPCHGMNSPSSPASCYAVMPDLVGYLCGALPRAAMVSFLQRPSLWASCQKFLANCQLHLSG